jgi:malate dehydrogenase (oxaloacetate-decarboxylating)(NADP+)
MRPVFEAARRSGRRIVFSDGEDARVLRAAQALVDDAIAHPVLLGRTEMIRARVTELGLRMDTQSAVTILDPAADADVFGPLVPLFQARVGRRGTPPDAAARWVRTRPVTAAALLVQAGRADAAILGGTDDWLMHWHQAFDVVGKREDVSRVYAMTGIILPAGPLFFVDTHLVVEPTAAQIAEMTCLAAEKVRTFGLRPKAALLSHSSFGASDAPSAKTMRAALRLIRTRAPDLEVDGEMHADAALVPAIRARAVADSTLNGPANLLVAPSLDAANIACTLVRAAADGLQVGPLLLGMAKPVHVLVPSVTARGIVNVAALTAAEAA